MLIEKMYYTGKCILESNTWTFSIRTAFPLQNKTVAPTDTEKGANWCTEFHRMQKMKYPTVPPWWVFYSCPCFMKKCSVTFSSCHIHLVWRKLNKHAQFWVNDLLVSYCHELYVSSRDVFSCFKPCVRCSCGVCMTRLTDSQHSCSVSMGSIT